MAKQTHVADDYAVAQGFMDAWGSLDMERLFGFWADDGVMEVPYQLGDFPSEFVGKEAFVALMGQMPVAFSSFAALDVHLLATSEPGTFVVEWRSEGVVRASGAKFHQRYICIIHVRDGKVTLLREYADPRVLAAAFS